jgi:hypothetical protein
VEKWSVANPGTVFKKVLNSDQFKIMWHKWAFFVIIGLVCEFIVGIIYSIWNAEIVSSLSFQITGITTPEFRSIAENIFLATITINGIILGFFSASAFFYLTWNSQKSQESKAPPGADDELLVEALQHVRANFTKYVQAFIGISVFLMLFQTAIFVGASFSPLLAIISLIVNLNALLIISTGLYPALTKVLNVY